MQEFLFVCIRSDSFAQKYTEIYRKQNYLVLLQNEII